MTNTVIKVENLSKQYRLGLIGTNTIKDDLHRWWASVRGEEDPFLKVGEVNDRETKGESDYVWALRDINFEVGEGEVLGIIGKNGAGKSTLLKILSQVAQPTTGTVKMKGKISSLLEVGTGFHPELTGRENIFLNGAILGMSKKEIIQKYDEIVDFSGVERYIDTPVKRYSSGMYVRLAFAVAANLEPDIMIIDEVLAVGDAEFQKKCLGKMKDVSGSGRTILFVSHNMTAMGALCSKGIYLKNGKIIDYGEMLSVINTYMSDGSVVLAYKKWDELNAPGDDSAKLLEVRLINEMQESVNFVLLGNKKFGIEFTYKITKPIIKPVPQIHFYTNKQDNIFISYGYYSNCEFYTSDEVLKPGTYKSIAWLPNSILNTQLYQISVGLANLEKMALNFWNIETIMFEVIEDLTARKMLYKGTIGGLLRPELEWENIKLE